LNDYFGVCPICKKNDGYRNHGRAQWMVCIEHKLKWCFGENLFSSWKDETPQDQERVWNEIGGFEVYAMIDVDKAN